MAKYRKKPVVIEAEQYIPGITTPFLKEANMIPIDSDTDWECKSCGEKAHYHMNCPTLEGWHIVCPYDYIIKGVKGEFYPCKPDIFEQTYEKADSKNLNQLKLSWVDDFSLFTIGFASAAVVNAFMRKQIIDLCILVPLLLLKFLTVN